MIFTENSTVTLIHLQGYKCASICVEIKQRKTFSFRIKIFHGTLHHDLVPYFNSEMFKTFILKCKWNLVEVASLIIRAPDSLRNMSNSDFENYNNRDCDSDSGLAKIVHLHRFKVMYIIIFASENVYIISNITLNVKIL